MNQRLEAQVFLDRLGERLGIGASDLSDDGEAIFRCDLKGTAVELRILLQEKEDMLSLCTAVGRMPADGERRADLASALLAANTLGVGTKGMVFSFSPADGQVYLGYSLLWPGASYELFEGAFARLVAGGAEWKQKLAALA